MFTGLKNKIKEEIGSDPPQNITHGSAPKCGHSRQGSGSNLGSLSLDGIREELVSSPSLLKQDSSEIKLPDRKVGSILSFKINEYVFFVDNKITKVYHSTSNYSLFILCIWIKGFRWHLECKLFFWPATF
jgi:hypothetical protein